MEMISLPEVDETIHSWKKKKQKKKKPVKKPKRLTRVKKSQKKNG